MNKLRLFLLPPRTEEGRRIRLYRSTAVNMAFALFKLGSGLFLRSHWLISLAALYMVLFVSRYSLVRIDLALRQGSNAEDALARRCCTRVGVLLLLLVIPFAGVIYQAVWDGEGWSYPGFLIYIMAAYAFYRVISSAVTLPRIRRESAILVAAGILDLVTAFFSLYALQTALLTTFGDGDTYTMGRYNFLVGAGIALLMAVLGVVTVRKANHYLH